tara:strand:+ start:172 stop:378 length:207 start_codon:yes stop_codon:yes gene_type:complete
MSEKSLLVIKSIPYLVNRVLKGKDLTEGKSRRNYTLESAERKDPRTTLPDDLTDTTIHYLRMQYKENN